MKAGKTLFPAIPLGRRGPWVLVAVSLAVLVTGLLTGDRTALAVGCIALAGFVIAFPLASLLAPKPDDREVGSGEGKAEGDAPGPD